MHIIVNRDRLRLILYLWNMWSTKSQAEKPNFSVEKQKPVWTDYPQKFSKTFYIPTCFVATPQATQRPDTLALGRTGGGDDDGDENKCYYKTRRDQSIEGGIGGHCREATGRWRCNEGPMYV